MRPPLPAALAVLTGLVLAVSACGAGSGGSDGSAEPAPSPSVASATPPTVVPSPSPRESTPTAPVVPDDVLGDLSRKAEAAASDLRKQRRRDRARAQRKEEREAAENPLAAREWAVFKGGREASWEAYEAASGETRDLLGEIALRPKATWFGDWVADDEVYDVVRDYIATAQAGDAERLVQLTVFRMVPWEHEACQRLPTEAEQASYRRWTDELARAIGSTPTAVILQPDGPFADCVPGGSGVPSELIAYSARVLSALPETSVYLDGGAADWPAEGQGGVDAAVDFLIPAGVEHVRGVALNSTHYSATADEVVRGAAIVEELAARGIPGKKVVVNTSSNGNPFPFGTYTGPDPDDAFVCEGPDDPRTCATLGIPPTTEVDDPRWGLSDDVAALAREHVDAYLWFGRPWLYRQNYPFELDRALQLVRSSPFVG